MIRALLGRATGLLGALSGRFLWSLIGTLLVLTVVQSCRVQSKAEEIGQLREQAAQSIEVAEGNRAAAVALAERLSACVNQNALDLKAERKANTALERRLEELDQISEDEQDAREDIYQADPDCEAWRTGLVCAAIADRMRGHSARLGRIGRSPGPGPDADPGGED